MFCYTDSRKYVCLTRYDILNLCSVTKIITPLVKKHVLIYNSELYINNTSILLDNNEGTSFSLFNICNHVCIKGPLVGRYETEISAVKVNWSILVGFRGILQSGSLLHKEAVDSHFKLIFNLESSRNWYFS